MLNYLDELYTSFVHDAAHSFMSNMWRRVRFGLTLLLFVVIVCISFLLFIHALLRWTLYPQRHFFLVINIHTS